MQNIWRKENYFILFLVLFLVQLSSCTKKKEAGSVENTIYLATIEKIKGLDPIFTSDQYSSMESNKVYEPLYQYHFLKRPYEIEPLLAQALPEVSSDKLTYRIKIRSGVKFHDDPAFPEGKGREVTANDFIYSLLRIADPKTQSTGWWILENRVVGLDKWREEMKAKNATDYSQPVEGLKAIDNSTIQIKLLKPYPQLVNILAMPYTAVVSKEAVEKYGPEFINKAVGTGPFRLESFHPTEQIIYVRNPTYWGSKYPTEGEKEDKEKGKLEDAGKTLPLADKVVVRVIIENQPRWMHFLKGELDIIGIPKDNFKDAVSPDVKLNQEFVAKGIRLEKVPALDFTYTAFNLESDIVPQFRDKRIRKAISLALSSDMEKEIELFYNGLAVSAQTPIPPGVAGYMSDYKNPNKKTDGLDTAKKLLAEAGYPEGKGFPEIPYDIVSSTTSRQIAEFSAASLKKIGLKVKIITNTWPEFQQRIQRRQTHFWGIAWSADYPDAENFLQLFYGPNAQPGGMNGSYYKNAKFDEIFQKARILPDSPARTKLYEQLAKILAEDCPVVFGVHRVILSLTQSWLSNYKYSEFPLNEAKYLAVRLDVKMQKQK